MCGNILEGKLRYRDVGNCYAVAQNSVKDIKETILARPKINSVQAASNKKLKFIFPEQQGKRFLSWKPKAYKYWVELFTGNFDFIQTKI